MITESFIYWFTRLDHLRSFCDGLGFIFCFIAVITFIVCIAGYIAKVVVHTDDDINSSYNKQLNDKDREALRSVWKTAKMAFAISFVVSTLLNLSLSFLPTTKEMAAIYVVPKIANNESLKEIGSEMADLAKEWLKELHPNKVNEKTKQLAIDATTNAVNSVASELTK